jgi:hypothetical protein
VNGGYEAIKNGQTTPIYPFITDIHGDEGKEHSSLGSQEFGVFMQSLM